MTAVPDWDVASDADLVGAAVAGDRRAFAAIYDRYADRLYDFCVGFVRDRDAAADCVQDVFCTAATQLGKLNDPDKLRSWLYAVARNEALRCLKGRRREQAYEQIPEETSDEPEPDTMAARGELAELIAQAAGGLSDRDRSVLDLTYRHGLDGPELARVLGVSAGSANRMVSRLRSTVEHSLGALLVARRSHKSPQGCPELREILAGWDGKLNVLMRKRIARHIDSCSICDADRRRLVTPAALLGGAPVFIPAPEWLRDRTLNQIQLTSTTSDITDTADGQAVDGAMTDIINVGAQPKTTDDETGNLAHRGYRWLLGACLLALIIGAIVCLLRVVHPAEPIAPIDLTRTPSPSVAPVIATSSALPTLTSAETSTVALKTPPTSAAPQPPAVVTTTPRATAPITLAPPTLLIPSGPITTAPTTIIRVIPTPPTSVTLPRPPPPPTAFHPSTHG
ncbi:MAG TPA: sigma-70 family RNA polymerase sigma factor [Mycobacterium sp.]|nr:sigma-70 family RNA polymerase sigma factor [Mycobacterium sp.]